MVHQPWYPLLGTIMIKVIPFPFCNMGAVQRFLTKSGYSFELSFDNLNASDIVILPGVGSFEQGMTFLKKSSLYSAIQEHAYRGGPVLGICLGMQLLFESSDESPGVKGLSLLKGKSSKIPNHESFSVPHIGWNSLTIPSDVKSTYSMFLAHDSLTTLADFYFVHSYVVNPEDSFCISSTFSHPSGNLCASIHSKSIVGFQFHPEKSGKDGYNLLKSTIDSLQI